MGSVAYTGNLGHCEQYICMLLLDDSRVLQLLANGTTGHGRKHELCRFGDRGNCYLQPDLLRRLGEESVHGTGGRGDMNV